MRRAVHSSCLGGLLAVSVVALAGCGVPSFPTGTGTATFRWHSVATSGNDFKSPPQSFVGTVAGIPVSGKALQPGVTRRRAHVPSASVDRGPMDGTFPEPHLLPDGVGNTAALRNLSTFTFDVDGTLGSQNVRLIIGPPSRNNPNSIAFHGTIGNHHVTGSVTATPAHGASNKATATFTVSG